MNEIIITVKPSKHRDTVKHALVSAGFKVTGSGYMLPTDTGDLCVLPPPGAHPDAFHSAPVETTGSGENGHYIAPSEPWPRR